MQQDVQVIEAVREGDRERYGELIERYQRLVYGIAWSRLGDRDLSEDVAQETFVQAFRYLATLRRPERFGAWVARIARNMTAAIARRSIREREGLRRWQLEQPDAQPAEAGAPEPDESLQDTLRQTLETLPAQHRESLVLYYLEGRSQDECARQLGINEGAFRTRLHRARAVLRRDLESRLADTLAALAPRPDLARRVLTVLPTMPLFCKTLKNTLIGSTFLFYLVPLLQIYAIGAIAGWLDRNLDQPGQNEREFWKRVLDIRSLAGLILFSSLIGGIVWLLSSSHPLLSQEIINMLMLGVGFGAQTYLVIKFMPLIRGVFFSLLLLLIIMIVSIEQVYTTLAFTSWCIFFLSLGLLLSGRLRQPFRLSQGKHLFRWAAQAWPEQIGEEVYPMAGGLSLTQLKDFGRLLVEHHIVAASMVNWVSLFRHNREINLSLYRIEPPVMSGLFIFRGLFSFNTSAYLSSTVKIRMDGSVMTRLSRADELPLQKLEGRPVDKGALERRLAARIQTTLRHFTAGDASGALRLLGVEYVAENGAEVMPALPRPVPRQRLHRGQRIIYGVLIVLALSVVQYGLKIAPWVTELGPMLGKPVRCEDAFALLSRWAAAADQPGAKGRMMIWQALQGSRFPPVQDLPPGDREKIKSIALNKLGQANIVEMLAKENLLVNLVANSLECGLLAKADLATVGLTAEAIRQKVAQSDPETRALILEPDWNYINLGLGTLALEEYAQRLSVFQTLGCLDLVDGEKVARFIASHQCLPAPPGTPAHMSGDETYCPGLFIYGKDIALFKPTCYSLRILQALGRLDSINCEACTRAIISLYVGHGFFRGKKDCLVFVLGEDDHYFALESLVILGVLDRVRDLKSWKYYYSGISPKDARDPRMVEFMQLRLVEYCAYTKRLEEIQLHPSGSTKIK